MTIKMITGDCRDVLKALATESVHCVICSPPYWGLRDYGTAKWEGGDLGCEHSIGGQVQDNKAPGAITTGQRPGVDASRCRKCGAIRIDSQLGLEPDFRGYVATMVAVFREVRRVLRKDGTLWLNLGDSYASSTKGSGGNNGETSGLQNDGRREAIRIAGAQRANERAMFQSRRLELGGLKPKDLIGIPWRVAFALQEDGWYLRQDIIWSKPNPMPESVTDRCTKAHEYLFLLSKSERYFYDAEAIKEEAAPYRATNYEYTEPAASGGLRGIGGFKDWRPDNGRNKRSVWEVATAPYAEAHFATFPPALIEPCIKAGTSERGCCAKCGAPWVRSVKKTTEFRGGSGAAGRTAEDANANGKWAGKQYGTNIKLGPCVSTETLGWSPSCKCDAPTMPCTVLDCFGGAGTTGLVADRLQRSAILIELSPAYSVMSESRIVGDAPLFAEVDAYDANDDFAKSIDEAYRVIRERKAAGGKGWEPP